MNYQGMYRDILELFAEAQQLPARRRPDGAQPTTPEHVLRDGWRATQLDPRVHRAHENRYQKARQLRIDRELRRRRLVRLGIVLRRTEPLREAYAALRAVYTGTDIERQTCRYCGAEMELRPGCSLWQHLTKNGKCSPEAAKEAELRRSQAQHTALSGELRETMGASHVVEDERRRAVAERP